ncbi:MAG: dipeptidase [Luteolibacter sp.]
MTPELEDLFKFLRFSSISTDSNYTDDTRACADWLIAKLNGMGLTAELHETARHPIVIARNEHTDDRPTVMIYGHYDVQPVDPVELWDTGPFEPEIRDGRIWARGATDNKGQMLAHILGVEKMLKEDGELPVNLIFLFEGEEEIGSPNLGPFLEAHKDQLKCDVIAISDTGMAAPNTPTLGYGLRGISCAEVIIRGPKGDLHSGLFGGAVANPATAVAQLVASLHDSNGKVTVEGFYDKVRELEPWEREMAAKTPGTADQDFLDVTGAPSLYGEAGYTAAERVWARPTLEVNGIGGGYQGEGSKTVLPAEAMAKFSCRLVPDQDPEEIFEQLKAHLEANCPEGVTLEILKEHGGKPYLADPQSGFGLAAQNALKTAFDKDPVLIREGGSIPIVQTFQDILGVDTLLLGLALSDAQIHAPNENFPVENFEAGIRLNQALLKELGKHSD